MTKGHDPIPCVASLRPGQPGPFGTTGFFGPEQVDDLPRTKWTISSEYAVVDRANHSLYRVVRVIHQDVQDTGNSLKKIRPRMNAVARVHSRDTICIHRRQCVRHELSQCTLPIGVVRRPRPVDRATSRVYGSSCSHCPRAGAAATRSAFKRARNGSLSRRPEQGVGCRCHV